MVKRGNNWAWEKKKKMCLYTNRAKNHPEYVFHMCMLTSRVIFSVAGKQSCVMIAVVTFSPLFCCYWSNTKWLLQRVTESGIIYYVIKKCEAYIEVRNRGLLELRLFFRATDMWK